MRLRSIGMTRPLTGMGPKHAWEARVDRLEARMDRLARAVDRLEATIDCFDATVTHLDGCVRTRATRTRSLTWSLSLRLCCCEDPH